MKALTLWPEWLFAILYLGKRIENRPRSPKWYGLQPGDWFALHAGVNRPTLQRISDVGDMALRAGVRGMTFKADGSIKYEGQVLSRETCPLGVIPAMARLGSACLGFARPWGVEDQWQWSLDEVRVLPEPVSCKGHQGGWFVPDEVEARIRKQLPSLPGLHGEQGGFFG